MKIERTKNATRNVVFGFILKIYQLVLPFIMRTIIIYALGPGYAGLNGLFTSILQVLNLAELGVGSAMIFSMYRPIAEDDENKVCALMALYRLYYRIIGVVIAIIGCSLLPFIPNLIKSDLPADVNVYILYIMNLAATVLTYWLFAYKNSILTAHQRIDVSSKISILIDTIKYLAQILVLVVFHNYYYYVMVILLTQIMHNIMTAFFSDKLYPQYSPKGKLGKDEIKIINVRIKDLFTSKLGSVIVNSADSIVISAFLGLRMLTIYQNYYYLVSATIGFMTIIFTSCAPGIGNSLVTESLEKNFNDLKKFSFIINWLACFCSASFLALMQPFMEIWMGKRLMQSYPLVIYLVMYFYLYEVITLLSVYKDAAGLWHEDRFRPLISALVNLFLNILMVNKWGLYGVALSTVFASLFVGVPWLSHNLFTVLFDRKWLFSYIKKMGLYVVSIVFICTINTLICSLINVGLWGTLIVRALMCVCIPNILFILIYRHTTEFKQCMVLVDKMTRGRLNLQRFI